ncbi:MAG: hypothetical protein K8H84_02960 [Sulfuricella denitrificans]|nr:hypothetical protein [Sulfuricella denitrificans]
MVSLAKLRVVLNWQRGGLLAALLALGAFATASVNAHESTPAGRVALPVHAEASGDKCVRDTSYMKRHHMDELKHHRKETMRKGIRTTEFSLQGCINCHADKKTNSVLGKEGFCQSCHSYAAVKLDCFECHASKPKAATALSSMPASSADTPAIMPQQVQAESVDLNSTGGVRK